MTTIEDAKQALEDAFQDALAGNSRTATGDLTRIEESSESSLYVFGLRCLAERLETLGGGYVSRPLTPSIPQYVRRTDASDSR